MKPQMKAILSTLKKLNILKSDKIKSYQNKLSKIYSKDNTMLKSCGAGPTKFMVQLKAALLNKSIKVGKKKGLKIKGKKSKAGLKIKVKKPKTKLKVKIGKKA